MRKSTGGNRRHSLVNPIMDNSDLSAWASSGPKAHLEKSNGANERMLKMSVCSLAAFLNQVANEPISKPIVNQSEPVSRAAGSPIVASAAALEVAAALDAARTRQQQQQQKTVTDDVFVTGGKQIEDDDEDDDSSSTLSVIHSELSPTSIDDSPLSRTSSAVVTGTQSLAHADSYAIPSSPVHSLVRKRSSSYRHSLDVRELSARHLAQLAHLHATADISSTEGDQHQQPSITVSDNSDFKIVTSPISPEKVGSSARLSVTSDVSPTDEAEEEDATSLSPRKSSRRRSRSLDPINAALREAAAAVVASATAAASGSGIAAPRHSLQVGPIQDDATDPTQQMMSPRTASIVHKTVTQCLHQAVEEGDLDELRRLLQFESAKLPPTAPPLNISREYRDTEHNQCSLLHTAAKGNHVHIIEWLIEEMGADPNAQDSLEATPLYYAVAAGHVKATGYLCNHGAQVNRRDVYYNTPFILALRYHFLDVANTLILFGADVNYKGKKGETALHTCCRMHEFNKRTMTIEEAALRHENEINSRLDQIRFLLDQGANVALLNTTNETAMFVALPTPQFLSVLIDHILANTDERQLVKWLTQRDIHGRNLVHRCCVEGHYESLLVLAKKLNGKTKLLQMLFNEKDNIYAQTPLHLAVQYRQVEIVKLLCMAREVDIDNQNEKGETAAHIACKNGAEDLARLLQKPGLADFKIKNSDGQTALQLAKQSGLDLEETILTANGQGESPGTPKQKKAVLHLPQFLGGRRRSSSSSNQDVNKQAILKSSMNSSWTTTRKMIEQRAMQVQTGAGAGSSDGSPQNTSFTFSIQADYTWEMEMLDKSNKVLADIIRVLYEQALSSTTDHVALLHVLGQLREFTKIMGRFAEEEKFLQQSYQSLRMESIQVHLAEHKLFKEKMVEFEEKVDTDRNCSLELLNFLLDYWQNHVMTKDKELAQLVQNAPRHLRQPPQHLQLKQLQLEHSLENSAL